MQIISFQGSKPQQKAAQTPKSNPNQPMSQPGNAAPKGSTAKAATGDHFTRTKK